LTLGRTGNAVVVHDGQQAPETDTMPRFTEPGASLRVASPERATPGAPGVAGPSPLP